MLNKITNSSNPPHINKLPTQQINELSSGQYRVLGREMLRLLLPKEDYEKLKGFVNREDDE